MKIFMITALVFILSGCLEGDQETTDSGTVELSELDSEPESAEKPESDEIHDSSLTIKFEQDVIYQSGEDIIMGVIASFDVDSQGRAFIADRGQTKIHVFHSDGSYWKSVGRQGQGPAEFAAISPNTVIRAFQNRLYIPDYANAYNLFPDRVQVFDLDDLSFSNTVNLIAENRNEYRHELNLYFPKQIYPRNDGNLIVSYHRMPYEYMEEKSFIRYLIQDSSGTLVSGPIMEQSDRIQLVQQVTEAPMPYRAVHTFSVFGKSLFAVSGDDKLYTARTEEFAIDIHQADGTLIRTVRHPFDRVPTSRRELLRHYGEKDLSSLGEGVAEKMIREADWLPDAWPALNNLIIDDENRLWVSTIVEDFDIYEWWVLENTGELITRFEWPRNEPIELVKNGYMYTRETDEETGLQQVVRYRVVIETN